MAGRPTVLPSLTCEVLEDRLALAGWNSSLTHLAAKAAPKSLTAMRPTLQRGTLLIVGTPGADTIEVRFRNAKLSVLGKSFAANQVKRIAIDAGAGNDSVVIGVQIRKPCTIYGGPGDDFLSGGGGNDILVGGEGFDTLDGGPGSNALFDDPPFSLAVAVDFTQEILRLVNDERSRQGLKSLVLNSQLQTAADIQAGNMIQVSAVQGPSVALQHTLVGTAQPTFESRLAFVGYSARTAAENLAFGQTSAAGVVAAWLASTSHRANLLMADVSEMGISVKADAQGLRFFCLVLASPK